LVFPGLSLGLGHIPRYFGGRKNSKASGKAEASAGVEAGRVVGPKHEGWLKSPAVRGRDRTLSRSCPAQKSKNFVSRPGTLRCAPCSFPPGSRKVAGPVSAPPVPVFAPLVEHSWTAVRRATAAAPPTETVFAELGRRARPAGLSIAGYLFLVAMLIFVALAARQIVSCGVPAQ
jgi:hypothetical protein